ncbi:hypothetical protein Pmani_015793 [Petrolisthes manimaculis]|uniref:Ionotropic glutamate receptor L-glutamate and glycine-binding domain-containing protein n=1 Tax=Petrolisthes manimaculis TaxID=1843537 RepID=A0AAE1PT12_9EUCA|nr:hypothetical protein Pmani_015793 [Petrolisthes manimaculis]
MYKREEGQPPHLYGRDVEVVRALAAVGNFVINFIQVPNGEVWGQRLPNCSWDGLVGMLGRGDADIGIANLFITSLLSRTDFQHFSAPFHQAVNCVVMKVPPEVPRWQSLTWPFREDVWLAMLMGIFISGPLLYTLSRNSAHRQSREATLSPVAAVKLSTSSRYAFPRTIKPGAEHRRRPPCCRQFMAVYHDIRDILFLQSYRLPDRHSPAFSD